MKINIITCMLMLISILTNAQYNKENLALEPGTQLKTYQYENLQLYPIRATEAFMASHKNLSKYVTLKEALEKKMISVTEDGNGRSGGSVNTLLVENTSRDTIMILSGEVVQGGKQDRMIAQDVILYPAKGKKRISVFCVEHGRWQAKGDGMEFKTYYSISSNEVRKAGTVGKDQQEVWSKVSEATTKNKAESSTGTLAALKESESFNESLEKYSNHFQDVLSKETNIIGFVAVSGDRILGCDMFATHGLLQDHYSNLINSYATEAITSGKAVTVPYEKVRQYLQAIIADESKQDKEVEKKGTQLKDGNKKIHISTF